MANKEIEKLLRARGNEGTNHNSTRSRKQKRAHTHNHRECWKYLGQDAVSLLVEADLALDLAQTPDREAWGHRQQHTSKAQSAATNAWEPKHQKQQAKPNGTRAESESHHIRRHVQGDGWMVAGCNSHVPAEKTISITTINSAVSMWLLHKIVTNQKDQLSQ